MPRKANPQALAIVSSPGIDEEENNGDQISSELNKHIERRNNNVITTPLSPLSPTTPKSPRSPFKFSLKPAAASHNNSGRPPMQVPDAIPRDDESRVELLPSSPTSPFHSQDHSPNGQNDTRRVKTFRERGLLFQLQSL